MSSTRDNSTPISSIQLEGTLGSQQAADCERERFEDNPRAEHYFIAGRPEIATAAN